MNRSFAPHPHPPRSLSLSLPSVSPSSGSGDDSLDSIGERLPRCPLTPSLSPPKRTTSQSKTEPPLLRTNKRTIYTAGRPPWYNVTGTTFKEAFVIGESLLPVGGGVGGGPDRTGPDRTGRHLGPHQWLQCQEQESASAYLSGWWRPHGGRSRAAEHRSRRLLLLPLPPPLLSGGRTQPRVSHTTR